MFICKIGNEEEVRYKGYHFIFNDKWGFTKTNSKGDLLEEDKVDQKFLDTAQEWYDKHRRDK